jgi:hypothetical protein
MKFSDVHVNVGRVRRYRTKNNPTRTYEYVPTPASRDVWKGDAAWEKQGSKRVPFRRRVTIVADFSSIVPRRYLAENIQVATRSVDTVCRVVALLTRGGGVANAMAGRCVVDLRIPQWNEECMNFVKDANKKTY